MSASKVVQSTIADRDRNLHLLLRPIVNDARVKPGLEARAGLDDSLKLGGETPEARRKNADDYFASWMDEYWVADRAGNQEQDLLLLVGVDGTVAYGQAGDARHVTLSDEVMGHKQISVLLRAIIRGDESARMLWSGHRLRTEAPQVPGLERGLYFAEASAVKYHTSGTGGDELVGIGLVATHRLDLDRVVSTGADAVFVDHGVVIDSTFSQHGNLELASGLERAAAAWLANNPDAGVRSTQLAGAEYYAMPLEVEGLTRGPVTAGLFYSREREFQETNRARTQLTLIGALLCLVAGAVAIALSRGLSRPINELSAAASKVAAGDLQVAVRGDRRDELGELARRFNAMVQGLREREVAKDALGRYLSPEMAHDLVTAQSTVSLQGQRRVLTILFCDVAGFTSISERLEPEALVGLLNSYLDQMVRVLLKHGAYVDKFEGDAIMAFWNAPREAADHARRACLAVLEMQAAAAALSAQWEAKGMPQFKVRYGLHTGVAIVGNMGATDKINYTAIGDSVNLASRLEGANKQYQTQLLISEDTWAAARDAIEARELDVVKVKGKQRGVRVFELQAIKGQLDPTHRQIRDRFEAGLMLYRERRFTEAQAIFDAAPTDGPSRTFAERCRQLSARPPEADWDGTYEMATK
jgi:class 3 adenylate cyclase